MSKQSIPLLALTIIAAGSGSKHRFITRAGAQAGVGARAAGVSRVDYVAEDAVSVDVLGTAIIESGGVIAVDDRLSPDASGRGVAVTPKLKTAVIAGGAAGNLTVTGIAATDELVSVLRADVAADTGTGASGNKVEALSDITAEFSITAANTINNTGGTDTTGDQLVVVYRQVRPVAAVAMQAASGAGEFIEALLVPAI
jgi:hypothetical protein